MANDLDVGVDPASAEQTGTAIGTIAGQSFVSSITNELPPVVSSLLKSVIGTFSEEGLEGLKKSAKEAADLADRAGVGLGQALRDSTSKMFSDARNAAGQFFKAITGQDLSIETIANLNADELTNKVQKLGEEGLEKVLLNVGVSPESIETTKDAFGSLTDFIRPFLDQEVLVEVVLGKGADVIQNRMKVIQDSIGALEKPIVEVNRRATELATPFLRIDRAGGTVRDISDALREYRERMTQASRQTGLGETELLNLERAFVANSVAAEAVDATISFTFDNVTKKFDGSAAAAIAFKGAGIDAADGAKEMAFAMRNLGLSSNEALERVGLFAEITDRTGEPITRIRKTINEGARALKFYGDTTKGVGQVYEKFLQTVGEGREELAAEFVGMIVQGVGQMNEGLRAFLGQVSGIGAGQGAIGGMLEVEERIAGGDIQGVLDAVTEQIETISGTGLLGRQEAIATGQQEQFFIQRKLLQDFLKVQDPEQATRLMENLARGQEIMAADLQAARGVQRLAATGEQRLQADLGVTGRLQNVADVTRQLGLTQNISVALQESSGNFRDASDLLLQGVEGLQSTLEGGLENFLERRRAATETRLLGDTPDEVARRALQGRPVTTGEVVTSIRQRDLVGGASVGAQTEQLRQQAGATLTRPVTTADLDFPAMIGAISEAQTNNAENWEQVSQQLTEFLEQLVEVQKANAEGREYTFNIINDPTQMRKVIKTHVQEQQNVSAGIRSRAR